MPQSVGQEPTIVDSTCGTSGDLKIGGEKSKLQLSEKIGNWVDNQETDACRMLLWRATHGDPGLWGLCLLSPERYAASHVLAISFVYV